MGKSPSGSEAAAHGVRITHYFTDAAWIDGRATQQLAATAGLSGMIAVAGYPDLHPGRNGPVGAAFLADRLFPQLVGNDIGCGMALFTLDLAPRKLSLDKAARRLRALEGDWDDAPEARGRGFGTIGGGNHFCEVQTVDRASMHGRIRKTQSSLQAHIRTALGGMVLCEDPDLLIEEASAAYKSAAGVLADLETLGLARAIATLRPVLTYKKTVEGR